MEISNKISFWESIRMKKNSSHTKITIEHWLDLIKNTPKQYLDIIESCRLLYDATGKSMSYSKLKEVLPISQLHGSFPIRKESSCESLSGYVYLDVDNCDLVSIKNTLMSNQYVYAIWKSVSGKGLGILVKYKTTKTLFNNLIKEIAKEIGIESSLDIQALGLARNNFLSHDKEIYINNDSIEFESKFVASKESVYLSYTKFEKRIFNLSIHFSDCKGLQFETILKEYPQDVVFIEHEYFKAFWPFIATGKPKKVSKGERNHTLTSFINNLRILNPTKKQLVLSLVSAYNNEYCSPSLFTEEIEKMVEYAYSKELQPIGVRIKKIWVDPKIKDKRKAVGEARSSNSKDKIEECLSLLLCENEKITPTKIIKLTGLSRATVYKYLDTYKEEITEFNMTIK